LSFVIPLGSADEDPIPEQAIAPEAEAQIASLSELHDSGGLSDEAFVRAQIEIGRGDAEDASQDQPPETVEARSDEVHAGAGLGGLPDGDVGDRRAGEDLA